MMQLPADLSHTLRSSLEPLLPFLYGRDDVIEVSLNGPNDLWVKYADRGYVREEVSGLDYDWALLLCIQLKNQYRRSFDEIRWPLLSTPLPGGHRVMAVLGPNTRSGIVISIRVRRMLRPSWEAFGLSPGRPPLRPGSAKATVFESGYPIGTLEDLLAAVRAERNVLVAGETGSGKTTFLNKLLAECDMTRRVLVIEDVEEIIINQPNRIGLIAEGASTGTDVRHKDILKAAMRLNPDILLCGEQQPENAEPSLRLLISGHSGFLSTIHAGDPHEAIEAWRVMVSVDRDSGAAAHVPQIVGRAIDRICVINSQHQVTEIVRPADIFLK